MSVHFVRCWPCQSGGCYETPRQHPWWDVDDMEHAADTGQDAPTGHCACEWCGSPPSAVEAAPVERVLRRVVDRHLQPLSQRTREGPQDPAPPPTHPHPDHP